MLMKKIAAALIAGSTKKTIFFSVTLMTVLFLLLSGCGTEPEPLPEPPAETPAPSPVEPSEPELPRVSVVQMNDFEIKSELENSYKYEYSEFSLGGGRYMTPGGREMPYQIRGIVAAPEGRGPFPLVLIAHGSHEEEDETKRFDTGFDYLVKGLAENGYVAVSLDVLMPYIQRYGGNDDYIEKMLVIVEDHIKKLRSANGGTAVYPVDLADKIDFERVALLGHSRSGAAIFQIASEQRARGLGVKALLSLAPSADLWAEFTDMLPTAFLIPQYDGDVIQLDGIFIYDYLAGRIAGDHSATLLMGANHNFFNRGLQKDDSIAPEVENGHPQLSRGEQEQFLISFAVDFFDASLGKEDRFYQTSQPQPNKMYGHDINRQLRLGRPADLIDAGTADNFSSVAADIRHVVDSVAYTEDDILINTVTTSVLKTILDGTRDKEAETLEYVLLNRDLIGIEWFQKDALVSVTPLISDFSQKKAMSLSMIPDSASELNKPGQAISFTVILRDSDGNEAKVTTAPGQNTLKGYPGKLRKTVLTEDFSIEYWEPATPLGMLHIPLSYFEAVNMSSIQSMELLFDGAEKGSVFIASWALQ